MAESDDQGKFFLKIMKTIVVDAHASDTIENIKAKVCTIEGVRGSQQELFFAGAHLRDTTKTLASYNITYNSTINLYVRDGMQIFVKIPSKGKTFNLDVKSSDTIEGVKAMIEDKEGISPERQELFYLGQPLNDHQMLAACDIRNDAVLHMVLRPTDQLQIFADLRCGKRISLQVRTWFTLNDVKMIIESMVGIPPSDKQNLACGGRNLEDNLTLSEYKITDGSILQLTTPVQIFVKTWTEGKTVTLMVDVSDTVRETLDKIGEKTGYNMKMHTLYYSGKLLKEERTLEHYNINGGDTVHLRVRLLNPGPTPKV